MRLIRTSDHLQVGVAAAARGADLIRQAIAEKGSARIVLATGQSQFETLTELSKAEGIDWPSVTAFHLDEYIGMPMTHPASFRLYLWTRFLSQLPLPVSKFYALNGETDPVGECQRVGLAIQEAPIDVAFVGIGENGHLAFNDPPANFDTAQPYLAVDLDEKCRQQQVSEGWFKTLEEVPTSAISMSVNQVLASRAIIAAVPGLRKATAVRDTVTMDIDPMYPATILKRHDNCFLYADLESSSLLGETEMSA